VTDSATSEIEKGQAEVEPFPAQTVAQASVSWYPPPSYPPPRVKASGSTDGRAIASLIAAIAGIVLGLPTGIPGMVLGTLAYFLGRSAVSRIDSSKGTLGGRSIAVSGSVFGVVAMAIGSVITLVWIVVVLVATAQPAAGG
jgi:hypothetical protein